MVSHARSHLPWCHWKGWETVVVGPLSGFWSSPRYSSCCWTCAPCWWRYWTLAHWPGLPGGGSRAPTARTYPGARGPGYRWCTGMPQRDSSQSAAGGPSDQRCTRRGGTLCHRSTRGSPGGHPRPVVPLGPHIGRSGTGSHKSGRCASQAGSGAPQGVGGL